MVHEDPDQLGYSTHPFEGLESHILCGALIPPHEQADIEHAGILAHMGHEEEAERARMFAGYDAAALSRDPR
jgi:hypothetical protein